MAPQRDANWIDGLRGVAALMVVSGHICSAFIPEVHASSNAPDQKPSFLQLPFLRLIMAGRTAVALFLLITGYTCALQPLAKARAGNVDAAFSSIARSALTRPGRLIFPTSIATIFSWVLAEMNAYNMIMHVDATWIRQGYRGPETSVWASIRSLTKNLITTWTLGWDDYDGTQWSLVFFLQGGMVVYTTLFIGASLSQKARKFIYLLLFAYGWACGHGGAQPSTSLAPPAIILMNVSLGMFIAELNHEYGVSATSKLPLPIPSLLIILGMFIGGYPQDAPERVPWSRAMYNIMVPFIPQDADLRRYWDVIACVLVMLGILFSKNGRRVLSTKFFNFLGRVSFPVYLLHNQLIKSVLSWMIYMPSWIHPPVNENGQQMDLQRGTTMHILVATAVYFYILYRLAYLWTVYVDPFCERLTKLYVSWMKEDTCNPRLYLDKPILGS